MNLPEILNHTPFAFGPLYLADENGRPVLVLVTRATFAFSEEGELWLADEQMQVNPAGVFWNAQPTGSYRYEPDAAFVKMGTDAILLGSALATRRGTVVADVGFRVGPLRKVVRVFGDRYWIRSGDRRTVTDPEPFERIPLRYERAFGGWDRSVPDPSRHTFDPRNPFGLGFLANDSSAESVRLPNLEDPHALIADVRDRPPPACFGFTSPDWQPRAQLAGTYDTEWARERKPLLPRDFDRRFFSAASPGLTDPAFLDGTEAVIVTGCTPQGRLEFSLPGVSPIEYAVQLRNRPLLTLFGRLDTVVVDCDTGLLHLTWRAYTGLNRGAHDVQEIQIRGGDGF